MKTKPEEGAAYARSTDPDTSHDAARAIEGTTASRLEIEVLNALFEHPEGLNCHELVELTGIPYQSLTPRFAPLRARGLIIDSGIRRKAVGSNRPCIVWIPAPKSMMKSLKVGDIVLDKRVRRLLISIRHEEGERYPGYPGVVTAVSESGFRVQWNPTPEQPSWEIGYGWEMMELGIEKEAG